MFDISLVTFIEFEKKHIPFKNLNFSMHITLFSLKLPAMEAFNESIPWKLSNGK